MSRQSGQSQSQDLRVGLPVSNLTCAINRSCGSTTGITHYFPCRTKNELIRYRTIQYGPGAGAMRTWRTAQRSVRSLEAIPSYRRSFSRSYRRDELYRVADLLRHDVDAAEVSVQGWTRAVRKQKRIAFASVGDGSTPAAVQAVLKPEDAAALVPETCGEKKTKKAPSG